MTNCVFCKIINQQIPSYNVYEDEDFVAFLDISQATYGHTLVVPKAHYATILEIPEALLAQAMILAKKIAIHQMNVLPGIQGINLLNNSLEVAGQMVPHFHIHVIPRYKKDEMTIASHHPQTPTKDAFLALQQQLRLEAKK